MSDTLFEKIGGEAAIDQAVEAFYAKVLSDDRIKHFFVGVDMDQQRRHMKRFMAYAFGSIPNYPGRSLREAHRRLVEEMGLSDEHFDAVKENLGATLSELNVPEELIGEAAAIVESARDDVLGRSS